MVELLLTSCAWASLTSNSIHTFGSIAAPSASLSFKTSFEEPLTFKDGTYPKEYLQGADLGFSFVPYDNGQEGWNHIIHQSGLHGVNIDMYFDSNTKHSSNRSLHLIKYRKGDGKARLSMFAHDTNPTTGLIKGEKIYVSRWVRLPENFSLKPDANHQSWFGLMSHRELRTDGDFSVFLDIGQDESGFYWTARSVRYDPWTPVWLEISRVQLPLGRWFKLESYIERHPTDGVLRIWVDGEPVFDLRNAQTKIDSEVTWIRPLMIMGDCDETDYPLEVWYDGLEIWEGLP